MSERSSKTVISPARRAAFDIMLRVEQESAYASVLLAALDRSSLSSRDHALAQEITLGSLRWQKSLDYFIEKYSNRDVAKIDIPVLIALRMGIYQLRHLSRVPHSAAINESVNLVKRARLRSAAGMVNAVLRNAARSIEDRAGEGIEDNRERKSIEVSHPTWMIERWRARLGESEALALAEANNCSPPIAFRANTLRRSDDEVLSILEREGVRARRSELVSQALTLESGPASSLVEAAERGDIHIQDEASQMVSLLVDAKPGQRILDLCAAPGSKSSHLAALSGDRAHIIACDIHLSRIRALETICRRLGAHSIDAVLLDATHRLPFAQKFDRVLLDAPCTGTGTLRRNPEIKWRLGSEDIRRLSMIQSMMIERAAGMVAVGGRLVYSTCSIEMEENEEVLSRFLASDSSFQIIRPDAHAALLTEDGFVRTFPHRHNTDGFFAAVLERAG